MRKIIFYRLRNGKCPIEDYFNALSKKEIKKAEQRKKNYFSQRRPA